MSRTVKRYYGEPTVRVRFIPEHARWVLQTEKCVQPRGGEILQWTNVKGSWSKTKVAAIRYGESIGLNVPIVED
jgi:hypothetical protein